MDAKWDILAPKKNIIVNNPIISLLSPQKNDAIISGSFLPRNAPKLTYSD